MMVLRESGILEEMKECAVAGWNTSLDKLVGSLK